jgi:hypothetical protein
MKYLFSVFFLFLILPSFSQDTIVKKNGDIIIAKISEITSSEVKYKKFDNQDGPQYILEKSKLKIIRFSNGTTEKFDLVPNNHSIASSNIDTIQKVKSNYFYNHSTYKPTEMNHFLMGDYKTEVANAAKISNRSFTAARATRISSIVFAGTAVLSLAVVFSSSFSSTYQGTKNMENSFYVWVVSSAACVTFLLPTDILKDRAKKYNKKAVRLYNQRFY